MAFPPGVQTVTVTAGASGYRTLDGIARSGTIRFTPSVSRVISAEHGVIALGTVTATLGASGDFTASLLAVDAEGFSPSGWTYRVDEEFTDAPGRAYSISLPAAAPTVDLPSLSPVDSTTGTVSSPAVISVNGETGIVIIGAADVGADQAGTTAAHAALTTSVHGIADTALLETAAGAASKVSVHAGGADSHGDRAYADGKFATSSTVSSLSTSVGNLDVFVSDCLNRVAAIEQGTAYLNGGHFTAPVDISEGGLTVTSSGTAILIVNRGTTSNFGGFALETGSSECWAVQMLNNGTNDLFVTDTANGVNAIRITPSPTTPTVTIAGVAAAGSKNGLTGIRLAGFKATSGAPTTGTWAAGDVVLDSAGAWHLCTAAGTPGTWT
ncbi:hypothetical protein [Streptomyces sp. NPDC086182]|uniref:hypothetical protein n=1 Tax=Streptomyces sp. NPDC086182 TaxID=3155058 RepID=UPI00342DDD24